MFSMYLYDKFCNKLFFMTQSFEVLKVTHENE